MAIAELLTRNIEALAFDNVTNPSNGAVSRTFALPPRQVLITWRTLFAVNPSAVSISIQVAQNNVSAEYQALDTSTYITVGEGRTVGPIIARFMRVIHTSRTGGSGITVGVMVG